MRFKHAKLIADHQFKVGSYVKIKKDDSGHLVVYIGNSNDYDGIIHTIKGEVAWVQCVPKDIDITATMTSNSASGYIIKIPKTEITTTFKVER